jgi:hypothetical protein
MIAILSGFIGVLDLQLYQLGQNGFIPLPVRFRHLRVSAVIVEILGLRLDLETDTFGFGVGQALDANLRSGCIIIDPDIGMPERLVLPVHGKEPAVAQLHDCIGQEDLSEGADFRSMSPTIPE